MMQGKKGKILLTQNGHLFFKEDLWLWIPVLFLAVIGVLFIYSSGLSVSGVAHHAESFPKFAKQIIWIFLGIMLAIFFTIFPFRSLSHYAIYLLPVFIILLIIPIFLPSRTGTFSWIRLGSFSLQPSEIFKPFFIISFAILIRKYQKTIEKPLTFFLLILFSIVPFLIIMLQRDLGTASVYLPITIIMLLRGNGNKKIIFGGLLFGGLVYLFTAVVALYKFRGVEVFSVLLLTDPRARLIIPIILAIVSIATFLGWFFYKKNYYLWTFYLFFILLCAYLFSFLTVPTDKGYGLLGKYQVERIVYPLDNDLKLTTSYNIEQARTAIGSGGLMGKGFLEGNLSHRRFVPEQPTDFIFSILGEEWGFLGSLFVLILYGIILIRIVVIRVKANDLFSSLVLSGILALFFYHMTINVGMNLGMLPVVGIPLMFVSYGGTAILTAFIGIGIIINLSRSN